MANSTPISNFIFFSSLLLTLSSTVTATTTTAAAVCRDTLYPSFCQKSLPINNATATLHDFARFAIRTSIAAATKFSDSIDNHLTAEKSTPVNATEIRALQDCRYLARLNVDFLSATYRKVNAGHTSLRAAASEHAQTMLSTVLTNTQTCIDGLQTNAATWTSQNDIVSPIKNNDKLYSVSLALFNKAFGRKKNPVRFFQ
ncbi:hypothetical protein OSB04_022773 [Centaurea solstitialis]|uniref:Pectinesterase inhibitor domain-containing protein n=1 Tax=Centaurea solstitialis TaxID=347529 RepID=A0AA38WC93_9ASTR|nr:hypothetical protein OSB04_022773 [Centaurea solstitialis]